MILKAEAHSRLMFLKEQQLHQLLDVSKDLQVSEK